MGLGNFLHKIGRGAAAARLSMHGYTPELLEKERALLRELYEEKQAERERKARADARAEEAAARAEQRAEEERQQRNQTHVMSTAKALADVVSIDPRTGEFLTGLTPEQADFYGLKPEQVDPVLTTARRIYQTKQDEDKAKREREKQEKLDAASEAEKTWLRHLDETDKRIRARRVPLTPKQAKDPDYVRAKEIVLATEDPDDPYTDPIALLDRIEKVVDELRKRRGAGAPTPEPNPFNPMLGYRPRAGSIFGRPAITSPGQPVGRWVRER